MSSSDSEPLEGLDVGILLAPEGTEEVEFTEPRATVEEAGATVEVIGPEEGEAQAVENDLEEADTYEVDRSTEDADAREFDALIVPGGTVGADTLRADEATVDLVERHLLDDGPTAAICHGPWVLVEADEVRGRTLTSYPSLQTDVRNAGGEWVDEEVVVDGGVITSRDPDDLGAFCEQIVEEFAEEAS